MLGLISTKHSTLESLATLRGRVSEAARFIDMNRLAISPQCGFASSIMGNQISFAAQLAKLELVATAAHEVWN